MYRDSPRHCACGQDAGCGRGPAGAPGWHCGGDPAVAGVNMGSLVGRDQARDVQARVDQLAQE